jgi:RNA polymerase sigma factor (sigma-70 family)
LPDLRDRARFGPWLLAIARRAIVDWVNSDARRAATRDRQQVVQEVERWAGEKNTIERSIASAEQAQIIIDSVLALPDPYDLIVYLNLIHEKEPTTIANELGLRPGTVRMQLKRGLAKLRKMLAKKFPVT